MYFPPIQNLPQNRTKYCFIDCNTNCLFCAMFPLLILKYKSLETKYLLLFIYSLAEEIQEVWSAKVTIMPVITRAPATVPGTVAKTLKKFNETR